MKQSFIYLFSNEKVIFTIRVMMLLFIGFYFTPAGRHVLSDLFILISKTCHIDRYKMNVKSNTALNIKACMITGILNISM